MFAGLKRHRGADTGLERTRGTGSNVEAYRGDVGTNPDAAGLLAAGTRAGIGGTAA